MVFTDDIFKTISEKVRGRSQGLLGRKEIKLGESIKDYVNESKIYDRDNLQRNRMILENIRCSQNFIKINIWFSNCSKTCPLLGRGCTENQVQHSAFDTAYTSLSMGNLPAKDLKQSTF